MTLLSRLLDTLINLLALLACLLICLLTGTVARNVIIRALDIGSLPWALEGSEYMLYGVTFFGAPWVLREGGHVCVDVFLQRMPQTIAHLLTIAADIAGAGISLFLVVYGIKVTLQSYSENIIIFRALVFPEWWILWAMPLTAICLVGEFIRRIARGLHGQAGIAPEEL